MIACLDVAYSDKAACAAGITFRDWPDASAVEERVVAVADVQPYQPGQFFRRELPCLLAVLRELPPVEMVIIDGYVWLGGADKPGLGAHLHQALGGRTAVIGVAKTRFRGAEDACQVFRGTSLRPLFVTAAGIALESAAELVRSMHGRNRIPTLLRRADYLCRHG
jgi:deoxyribonuclease V